MEWTKETANKEVRGHKDSRCPPLMTANDENKLCTTVVLSRDGRSYRKKTKHNLLLCGDRKAFKQRLIHDFLRSVYWGGFCRLRERRVVILQLLRRLGDVLVKGRKMCQSRELPMRD